MSISNINKRLTKANIPKAIGEIIPIMFVKELSRILVKIKPTMNIDKITPEVTSTPSITIVFLVVDSVETLLAR